MYQQTVKEKILQRRLQMFVHCHLYYNMDVTIVSDEKWHKWAEELVQLQKDYPVEANEVQFASYFSDWDASTGAFLKIPKKYQDRAEQVYYIRRELNRDSIKYVKKDVKPKKTKKDKKMRRGTKALF